MKKILQKSLASMVSAALCLTAFVGCLTVNAETGTGTFTVESQKAKPGASVTVPVSITSDETSGGLAAAIFDVTFDTAVLTPTAIAAPSANLAYGVDYRTSNGNEIDVKVDTKTGLGTIRVLASLKDDKSAPVKTGMIANITFTVKADAAIAATDITLSNAQACNFGTADATGLKYDNDEDLIAMTTVNGTVTVESATTGPVEIQTAVLKHDLILTETVGSRITVNYNANANSVLQLGYSDYTITVDYQRFGSGYVIENDSLTFSSSDRISLSTSTLHRFDLSVFALTEMSLNYTVTIHLLDENGVEVAYYKDTTSIANQANVYAAKYSTNTKLLKTLADMVMYGSAAQTYFAADNPGTAIDNEALLPTNFFDYEYAASTVEELPSEYNLTNSPALNHSVFKAVPDIAISSSTILNIRVRTTGYDPSTLTAKVSYTSTTNGTSSVISQDFNFSDLTPILNSASTTLYRITFDKLAVFDLDKTIAITVYENGTPAYTLDYCAHSAIKGHISEDVYIRMVLFSESAAVYLGAN